MIYLNNNRYVVSVI